jgi:hypothetical protein
MKAYVEVEAYLHSFFNLVLDGVSGQLHAPVALSLAKIPCYALNRTLVGPRADLDVLEKRKNLLPQRE